MNEKRESDRETESERERKSEWEREFAFIFENKFTRDILIFSFDYIAIIYFF